MLEKVPALLGPADAETLSDVGSCNEARATALMNFGIVELGRIDSTQPAFIWSRHSSWRGGSDWPMSRSAV